jgi:hypothetical protein
VAVFPSEHSLWSVKAADDGREETRASAVDPVDAPQTIREVEEAERHTLEERAIGDAALIDVAKTAQDGLHHHWRFELDPLVRAHQPFAKTAMTNDPFTLKEIEVASRAWPGVGYATRELEERHRRILTIVAKGSTRCKTPRALDRDFSLLLTKRIRRNQPTPLNDGLRSPAPFLQVYCVNRDH